MVRRHLVLLAAAAVAVGVVLLVLWMWGRRGAKEGITGSDDSITSDGHKRVIDQWCRSGKKVSAILGDYPQLAKYTYAAVIRECNDGAQAWLAAAKKRSANAAGCGNKSACSDPVLSVTHPCHNNDGDKCCVPKDEDGDWASVPGMQNCITKTGAISKGELARVDTEVVVQNGCAYDSRRFLNNRWACRPGLLDTGVNWYVHPTTKKQVPIYIARQQCAQTEACRAKARGAFNWAKGEAGKR